MGKPSSIFDILHGYNGHIHQEMIRHTDLQYFKRWFSIARLYIPEANSCESECDMVGGVSPWKILLNCRLQETYRFCVPCLGGFSMVKLCLNQDRMSNQAIGLGGLGLAWDFRIMCWSGLRSCRSNTMMPVSISESNHPIPAGFSLSILYIFYYIYIIIIITNNYY